MSSPPDNLGIVDHNISNSFLDETSSDIFWPCAQDRGILFPIQNDNPTCSFSPGMFQDHGNSQFLSSNFPPEVSDWLFFQESSTSLHATEFNKSGKYELNSSDVPLGEEFSALAMSSINEGIPENTHHHHKNRNFFSNHNVSNDAWPSSGERIVGDLDSNMPLENENLLLDRSDEGVTTESTILNNDCQNHSIPIPSIKDIDSRSAELINASAILDQENTSLDESNKEKGFLSNRVVKRKEIKHRFGRLLMTQKMEEQPNAENGGSTSKKQEHNAKEKVRRMKLNASYLALGSLLPNSRRSKKRWAAPVIIDKVLEYIPELQSEIEELTIKKKSIASRIEKEQPIEQNACVELQAPTVSVHEVKQGEVIIQTCMQPSQDKGTLSNLMQNLEAQGMVILSASSIDVCDDRICYHVHVQMNENPIAIDNVALRKKVISLLS